MGEEGNSIHEFVFSEEEEEEEEEEEAGGMATEAAAVVKELRAGYGSGRTRPLSWRLGQLTSISAMLLQREHDICQALLHDLNKPPFETFYTEIAPLGNACKLAKDNLKSWTAPQKVSVPLPVYPGSGALLAEPLGVVLIFSSWNFPLLLALDPVIGAIAAGNAIVLKPSETAPATSALLAKLIPQYLDDSVIRVIEGGIAESTELLGQRWDKIFYTGSSQVGRIIMTAAAKHLTPVTLELGGKCPLILDGTIDFKVAARRIASGKWGINFGQACLSPDYILSDEIAGQKLINALKETLHEFYGHDPSSSPDLSRIVNQRHFSRLRNLLEDPGTVPTIVHGGKCNAEKLFIEPTVLLNPPLDSPVMTEEIFGPILPVITTKTIEDAIDFVNLRTKPLCLYLFTNDKTVKEKVVHETSSGAVTVNDCVIQFGLQVLPFGGIGESGMGAYHGKYSFDTFSHLKPVLCRSFWGDITARYPPYTQQKQSLLKAVVKFDYIRLFLILLGIKK